MNHPLSYPESLLNFNKAGSLCNSLIYKGYRLKSSLNSIVTEKFILLFQTLVRITDFTGESNFISDESGNINKCNNINQLKLFAPSGT